MYIIKKYTYIYRLNTEILLTTLCLSVFELYRRWIPLFSVGYKGKYGEIKRAVRKNGTDTSSLIDIKTKADIITKKPYLISQPQLNQL